MPIIYSQDFETLSAGITPAGFSNGWTVSTVAPTSGTKSFTGALRVDGYTSVYTGISAVADMVVTGKQVINPFSSRLSTIGIAARVDATFSNGYLLMMANNLDATISKITLFKKVAGTFFVVDQSYTLTSLTSGMTMAYKLSVQGNRIRARIWNNAGSEPTFWQVDKIDTAVTAAGYAGLYYGLDTSPATTELSIDDITISNPATYTNNFDALTTGAAVSGFTNNWIVSTANPVSGTKTITSPTKTDGDISVLTGITAAADMEFSATHKISFNTTTLGAIGIGVRSDSTYTNGYLLALTHSPTANAFVLNLLKKVAGVQTSLGPFVLTGQTSGSIYNLKISAIGTSIKCKAWVVGTAEPDWQITATDSDVTAAGYPLLYYVLDGLTTGTEVNLDDVLVSNPSVSTLYSANFDALSAGAAVAGWSNNWIVSTVNPVSGTKAITMPVRPDGQTTVNTSFTPVSDMEFTGKQVLNFTGSTCPSIGISVRTDASYNNGYLLLMAHSGSAGSVVLFIHKRVGGVFTALNAGYVITGAVSGSTYVFKLKVSGTSVQGKAWVDGASEPDWLITQTDSSITGPGYVGLYYALDTSVGTEVTIDDLSVTDLAVSTPTILPNNAAIVYSPYNWNVTSGAATTINAGAYFSTKFTGTICTLNFDVTTMGSPASQIWYRIDGLGAWTKAVVTSSVNCVMPADTVAYQQHLLEVVVKSTSETLSRWSTLATAVKFNGIVLGGGGTVALPGKRNLNVLVFGDSITEGVRTINSTSTSDTDRNDAMQTWNFNLSQYLGAEIGVVGFGGQGWNNVGSGSVPILPSTYNLLYSGATRTFSPAPDMVVVNMGTNDSTNNVVSQIISFLNGILSLTTCKIVMLVPFNGFQAANLATAASQCNQPNRVTLVQTTGFFNSALSSDGVHPYGFTSKADIAPSVASPLKSVLNPVLSFAF